MINATLEYYLKDHLAVQNKTPGAVTPEAFAEYFRCYQNPSCVHAVCEDYRAAATVDAEIENEFQGRKAQTPLLALWGAKGTVGQLFDVLGMWRERVEQVSGGALPCGHLIPEEDPEDFLSELKKFLHR
jgi:haloacetate dehalogenase